MGAYAFNVCVRLEGGGGGGSTQTNIVRLKQNVDYSDFPRADFTCVQKKAGVGGPPRKNFSFKGG